MDLVTAKMIGSNIKTARKASSLTQFGLATATGILRVQIVRMEAGLAAPRLDEAVRIAEALRIPLEWLTSGRLTPGTGLNGIALELAHLGIWDLIVSPLPVPGAFRYLEEVLVLAVSGDRPEPRLVEAVPFLLARHHFRASLVTGFANLHDRRARGRVAWLSEVTLALSRSSTVSLAIRSEASLRSLVRRGVKAPSPDSLGHPGGGTVPPIWRRWNISYAGTLQDFLRRTIELIDG